jgi:hypothetical protein
MCVRYTLLAIGHAYRLKRHAGHRARTGTGGALARIVHG